MAWSRVISRPGSSRSLNGSRGDSANENNLVAEGTASGGPREEFGPGDLAFPPTFAPRAPHPPPRSPSGNSAAARRRRCGGGGRGEMPKGNRAGPHHLLHTHTRPGLCTLLLLRRTTLSAGREGQGLSGRASRSFVLLERTLFTVHVVQFTPLLYTAAAGTPAGRSRFYATLGGGPPDAPPLLPARLPAWRGSSPNPPPPSPPPSPQRGPLLGAPRPPP